MDSSEDHSEDNTLKEVFEDELSKYFFCYYGQLPKHDIELLRDIQVLKDRKYEVKTLEEIYLFIRYL